MFGRKRTEPARQPHPDSQVEAELQRVIALQKDAERTEGRLDDILAQLREIDGDRLRFAGRDQVRFHALGDQADGLRRERAGLEARLPALQEDIGRRLEALGNDAVYL